MFVEIVYEGERLFVNKEQLAGYDGCTVLAETEDLPTDEIYLMTSKEHLAAVHAQKAAEAVLVLSGYVLTAGLLFEEALALKITILELAQKVNQHRRHQTDYEIARRCYKKSTQPKE